MCRRTGYCKVIFVLLSFIGISWFLSSCEKKVSVCGETVDVDPKIIKIANILNETRTKEGLDCLKINQFLNQSAQNHAEYMYQNGILTHEELENNPGFSGENELVRIRNSGYPGSPGGEFLAQGGNNSPEEIAQMWIVDESRHKEYLLTPGFTDLGVGFSGQYWVVNFGGQ